MTKVKSILLLGGTGAIGNSFVDCCKTLDCQIYITSRRRRVSDSSNIEYLHGNAKNLNFIKQLSQKIKPDVLIDFMVYETDCFKSHLPYLMNICKHYIFLSSYRVFSTQPKKMISEGSPRLLDVSDNKEYLNTCEYALEKTKQEDYLKSIGLSHWTIVRPSITYSDNRFQFGPYEKDLISLRIQQNRPIPILANILDKKTTLTFSNDVAEMIIHIMNNKSSFSNDFNLCTGESITWRKVGKIYNESLGLKVEEVSDIDFNKLNLDRWQLKFDRSVDRVCNNSKILEFCKMQNSDLRGAENGIFNIPKISNQAYVKSYLFIFCGRMDKILKIKSYPEFFDIKGRVFYLIGRITILDKIFLFLLSLKKIL